MSETNRPFSPYPFITLRQFEDIVHDVIDDGLSEGRHCRSITVLGPVGVGKSQSVRGRNSTVRRVYSKWIEDNHGTVIAPEDIPVVAVRVNERDAAEMAGPAIPLPDEDGNYILKFSQAPKLTEVLEAIAENEGHPYAIFLMEEITDADEDQSKVICPLLDENERSLGDDEFPVGCLIFANGNMPDERAGANELMSKYENRTEMFVTGYDYPSHAAYMERVGTNVMVQSFLKTNNDVICTVTPDEPGAFCTARSITEGAGSILDGAMRRPGFDGTLTTATQLRLRASIGESAAKRLIAYVEECDDVPEPDEIFRDPEAARLSPDVGFQWVGASAAMRKIDTMAKAEAMLVYLTRMFKDLQAVAYLKLTDIVARSDFPDSNTFSSPLWVEFDQEHHNLIKAAN